MPSQPAPIRIRPRTAIADAELARTAVVDLPSVRILQRPHTPRALVSAVAAVRRPVEPERVIVMTLQPVPVRSRG